MTVKEMTEKMGLKVFTPGVDMERGVAGGYVSDLLSDVMGHAREGEVWVTLQTHKNIAGIASLKDLAAIVLVKGFTPAEDAVSAAESEGIPILGTDMQTFEFAGHLYAILNK